MKCKCYFLKHLTVQSCDVYKGNDLERFFVFLFISLHAVDQVLFIFQFVEFIFELFLVVSNLFGLQQSLAIFEWFADADPSCGTLVPRGFLVEVDGVVVLSVVTTSREVVVPRVDDRSRTDSTGLRDRHALGFRHRAASFAVGVLVFHVGVDEDLDGVDWFDRSDWNVWSDDNRFKSLEVDDSVFALSIDPGVRVQPSLCRFLQPSTFDELSSVCCEYQLDVLFGCPVEDEVAVLQQSSLHLFPLHSQHVDLVEVSDGLLEHYLAVHWWLHRHNNWTPRSVFPFES